MSSFTPSSPVADIPGDGRHHVHSMLMRESLLDKRVMSSTETPIVPMLPFCRVLKVGGRSIVDRGKSATYPLVDVIVAALAKFKLVIATGGGIPNPHRTAIGMDLRPPTRALTQLPGVHAPRHPPPHRTPPSLVAVRGRVWVGGHPAKISRTHSSFPHQVCPACDLERRPAVLHLGTSTACRPHPTAPYRRRQFFVGRMLRPRQPYADQ